MSEPTLPWFQFFAGDWIASGTRMAFSYEEQGIYILLLAHCWRYPNCCLPDDRDRIARLCPNASRLAVDNVLDLAFTKHPTCSGYTHTKLLAIRESQTTRSESARRSIRKRWEKRDTNVLQAQYYESNTRASDSDSRSGSSLKEEGSGEKPKRKRAPKAPAVEKREYAPGVHLAEVEYDALPANLGAALTAAGLPADAGSVTGLLGFYSAKKQTGYRSKADNDRACIDSWVIRAYLEDIVKNLRIRHDAQRIAQASAAGTNGVPLSAAQQRERAAVENFIRRHGGEGQASPRLVEDSR